MKIEEYQLMADQQRWHWWYVTKRRYLAEVLRSLVLPPGAKVLDLGSGVGANFSVLATFGNVLGVEQSLAGRKLTKQITGTKVVAGDLNTYTPQSNEFDLITILDVLYHQHIRSDEQVIRKALRGLKPKGFLLITDCAHPWLFGPHDVANMARERYTKAELQRKVEAAGGKVVRCSYLFCFSFPFFVITRLSERAQKMTQESEVRQGLSNTLLSYVGWLESKLLRFVNLPFGSSLLCVVQKKD